MNILSGVVFSVIMILYIMGIVQLFIIEALEQKFYHFVGIGICFVAITLVGLVSTVLLTLQSIVFG